MGLSPKQNLLAVAQKQTTDQIPFVARIDLWYNYHLAHGTLPEKYRNCNMLEIVHDQRAGIQVRNIKLWKYEYKNIEVVIDKCSDYTSIELKTPKGILKKKTALFWKQGATTEYELEFPFKSVKDYPAIEFLLENTVLVPYMDDYIKAENMVKDDGLVICGESYSPMQAIMRRIMGYESFFYELHDHPKKVEQFDVALPVIEMSLIHYRLLMAAGFGDEDISALFREKRGMFVKDGGRRGRP